MPRPPTPIQIPIAFARSSRGKTSVRIDSVPGITSAAPAPCSARNAISAPALEESAAPTEASPKTTMPIVIERRRPKRSPIVPPASSSAARTIV